jgi:hypothetical protein
MALTLIDDGTLDTVFRCDDCGGEMRYSAEWRASYQSEDPDNPEEDFEAMIEDALVDHEGGCEEQSNERIVTCQVELTREDFEMAHAFQDSGGYPVRAHEIARHPNSDEDGPFLEWLEGIVYQERLPDLQDWFMRLVKGEQTIADLRSQFEDGE